MRCKWSDCLTCPYPDCVKALKEENPEVHRRYYERHKEQRLAYAHAYNATHKAERHEYNAKRWANMTEEQKEKERTRQREYHRRKKHDISRVS